MTSGEPVEIHLARLAERVEGLTREVRDGFAARGTEEARVRELIAEAKKQASEQVNGLRQDLEKRIDEHQKAVNPHAAQEEWLREGMRSLLTSLEEIKTEIATSRGTGRVLWLVGGAGVSSGVTFLVTKALGG